jgi:hypothetical protein
VEAKAHAPNEGNAEAVQRKSRGRECSRSGREYSRGMRNIAGRKEGKDNNDPAS